jgi:hypothetical protein
MPDAPRFPPMPGSTGFIHRNDEQPAYWMRDILWIMLADANDTGGRWSMMEQLMPMGAGPPPHKHLWSDKTFFDYAAFSADRDGVQIGNFGVFAKG